MNTRSPTKKVVECQAEEEREDEDERVEQLLSG